MTAAAEREAVRAQIGVGGRWRLAGYLDDDPERHGTAIDGVPVLGDELGSMTDVSVMVCMRLPDNYVSCPGSVEALGLSPEH